MLDLYIIYKTVRNALEGRVQRDIWYIEHWTFMLDLYIIYKTVRNALEGEKEAY
jgi:putative colanic acid biosynthesis UDP-glucose lipid carrier transferase